MKTVVITGISGTLGRALGAAYAGRGWKVVGVSRQASGESIAGVELVTNAQATVEDARALLAGDPDLVILNAGQIEDRIGDGGLPLVERLESITRINYLFPATVALEAARAPRECDLDIVAIGSIADGSPSPFGPLYHASKIALHYFVSATGPIVAQASPGVRLRLYRPGVIRGPLSWAPVNRLNERATRIRARRCERAPAPEVVAGQIVRWIDGKAWIGTGDEPLSFKLLKYAFALAPGLYRRIQGAAWRKGSRFAAGTCPRLPEGSLRARS